MGTTKQNSSQKIRGESDNDKITTYSWEEKVACMRSPEVQEMFSSAIAILRSRMKRSVNGKVVPITSAKKHQ